MIRDAVIHLLNEQPLVADLLTMPLPGDVTLHCTNLRTLNRKRPVFVDQVDAAFIIPYVQVRFVEIPVGSSDRPEAQPGPALAAAMPEEIELDEDLLRRVREL
ncbi:MAG TPA: hypothetical protein VLM76_14500 [Patescibacteria group bacterium]|nr:hypothetical protein [Patescibacteria group bacterium]